jgi:hypothetical protein
MMRKIDYPKKPTQAAYPYLENKNDKSSMAV